MWPFRREIRPPASETWQPGDVAECIHDDWVAGPAKRPALGDHAIVLHLYAGHTMDGPRWLLKLLGFAGLWNEPAFRKVIVPPGGDESVELVEVLDRLIAAPSVPTRQRLLAAAILVAAMPLGRAGNGRRGGVDAS